ARRGLCRRAERLVHQRRRAQGAGDRRQGRCGGGCNARPAVGADRREDVHPVRPSAAAPPRLRRLGAARQDHLDGLVAGLADVPEPRPGDDAAGAPQRLRVPVAGAQDPRRRPERDDDGDAGRRRGRTGRRQGRRQLDPAQPGRLPEAAVQRAHRNGGQQRRLHPGHLGRLRAELRLRPVRPAHRRQRTDRGVPARASARLEIADAQARQLSRQALRHGHHARCQRQGDPHPPSGIAPGSMAPGMPAPRSGNPHEASTRKPWPAARDGTRLRCPDCTGNHRPELPADRHLQGLRQLFPGPAGQWLPVHHDRAAWHGRNPAYLVGFMDYGKDDMSRPAAIPGWTEIDYSTGQSPAGHFWMNQVDLRPSVFQDYRQVLNLHDATLTTSYRYLDHGRSTRIVVQSLVSEASPHLAASRISITPEFDGVVQLSFAFNLWAPYQPRLPLAKLSGDQMQIAVAAHNLTLQAVPPATPDRAAVWYHGDTHVLADDGDSRNLTLWLD